MYGDYVPMNTDEAVKAIGKLQEQLEDESDAAKRTRLYYEIMLKGLYITEQPHF